jgi:hypothetical protein
VSEHELGKKLLEAVRQLNDINDRLVIEDSEGFRYIITRTFAVGTQTDDPGVVIRIEKEPPTEGR